LRELAATIEEEGRMITRRRMLQGAALAGFGLTRGAWAAGGVGTLGATLSAIEADSGGRLGVAVLDTATGARCGHRADERFAMCSTFKLLAAGAILARVDGGRERLDRRIRFAADRLVAYSPVTREHAGRGGMTLGELCEAAITYSDNTAANMLLAALGGPTAITAYARTLGDRATRLDRIEPELNQAAPGDPRDVTTPAAMLGNLRRLTLRDALTPASRDQLTRWLRANKTGDARLRAQLPAGWRVGDKTGSGGHGSTNDVGLLWPPDRAPILVAVYLTQTEAPPDRRDATVAAVGRAVAEAI
jgi:beta-lactamase class A